MAINLIEAGFDVHFHSRRLPTVEALRAAGATAHDSVPDVTSAVSVVLSCLPADKEINDVFMDPGLGLQAMSPGSVIIEASTARPETVQNLATAASEYDVAVLDAPISGGVYGAERGTLAVMVGGDHDQYSRCLPVFEAIGANIFHVGPVGMGKVFKLINNMLTGVQTALIGEALTIAVNAGADLDALREVVSVSSGNSNAWNDVVRKMMDPPDAPGFRLELMRKDLDLVLELAKVHDAGVPIAASAAQFYAAAVANGMSAQGTHEVARFVGKVNNVDIGKRA